MSKKQSVIASSLLEEGEEILSLQNLNMRDVVMLMDFLHSEWQSIDDYLTKEGQEMMRDGQYVPLVERVKALRDGSENS